MEYGYITTNNWCHNSVGNRLHDLTGFVVVERFIHIIHIQLVGISLQAKLCVLSSSVAFSAKFQLKPY